MLQCLLVLDNVILSSTTNPFYKLVSYVEFLEVNIVDEWMFEIKFRSWIYRLCSKIFWSFNIMMLLINACMQAYRCSISCRIPSVMRQCIVEERGPPFNGRATHMLFNLDHALTEFSLHFNSLVQALAKSCLHFNSLDQALGEFCLHFNSPVHPLAELCLGVGHALTELGLGPSIGNRFLDYISCIYVLLHLLIPYSTTTSFISNI